MKADLYEMLDEKANALIDSLLESDMAREAMEAAAAAKAEQIAKRNHRSFGRYAIVNRVRGGKIQRNKMVSEKKGFKIKDGVIVKMSFAEKKRRKLAARIASRKRRAKQSQINFKTKLSMRIRDRRFGG